MSDLHVYYKCDHCKKSTRIIGDADRNWILVDTFKASKQRDYTKVFVDWDKTKHFCGFRCFQEFMRGLVG